MNVDAALFEMQHAMRGMQLQMNQLEQENRHLRQVRGPPRQLPRITFANTKDEDFLTWICLFEGHGKFFGYDDLELRHALSNCMRGEAAKATSDVNPELQPDYAAMREEYESHFLPPSVSVLAQAQFETAKQGAGEGTINWHS